MWPVTKIKIKLATFSLYFGSDFQGKCKLRTSVQGKWVRGDVIMTYLDQLVSSYKLKTFMDRYIFFKQSQYKVMFLSMTKQFFGNFSGKEISTKRARKFSLKVSHTVFSPQNHWFWCPNWALVISKYSCPLRKALKGSMNDSKGLDSSNTVDIRSLRFFNV